MTRAASAEYPSRPRLSPSEQLSVLRNGPALEWFSPFAVLGEVRTARPNSIPYGLVHLYYDADGTLLTDVQTFRSEEDARWAAEHLYRVHQAGCRCELVFYWTPKTVNYGPEVTS